MTTENQTANFPQAGTIQQGAAQPQSATGIQAGANINGVIVDRVDPQTGRPFVHPAYFDQFPKNAKGQPILPAQLRPANWIKVPVLELKKYNRGGQPRVSFNQGAIHVSYSQLKAAGVHNPDSLVGKQIMVDFFQRGDVLLNGSITTDAGRIVNRFMVEPNPEVENKLEYELKKESLLGWAGLVSQQYGANTRGQGEGLSLNTNQGVIPATQIPQMIPANQSAGMSRAAADSNIDQRLQQGPQGTGQTAGNDAGAGNSAGGQGTTGGNTGGAAGAGQTQP